MKKFRTLQEWIAAHPGINALAFEVNSDKYFGLGSFEEVCGFCLASHYYDGEPPMRCTFCRSPFEEARAISEMSEVRNRVYSVAPMTEGPSQEHRGLFVVPRPDGRRKL